jgi:hypothetical protein
MKIHALMLLIILISISCQQPEIKTLAVDIIPADTVEIAENFKEPELPHECSRGVAEPIVLNSVFPNSYFKLQTDNFSGIEIVEFDNDERLIITNQGCDSFWLTFRFETSRFKEDTTNLLFWYKTSVLLMNEILEGLNSPINIGRGTNELKKFINSQETNAFANLKLHEEVDFGGDEIRDYVSLDRIQKIDNDKFAIEISFVTGPL